jgi:hypothetical protein
VKVLAPITVAIASGQVRLSRVLEPADCEDIGIIQRSHVHCLHGHQRPRPAVWPDEFDLNTVWFIQFNNRANIPSTKPELGDVAVENHCVEQMMGHCVRTALHSRSVDTLLQIE